ncbi:Rha family transcriptional regulator [Pediococcus pentosaceus]|uniref:Rha family transcriptional regulator n=1 Tax=Pediococcus pentosaceus TaxID=1255 RepID=UPI000258B906|nr:Rha family transcriptional regulator [Pediococcus pentosaceus]KAF0392579.1 transcriptional regulator [Pediococcus pentosaceus]KAF0433313.1 transcriptional regulator [Pediococcus pentosaceus]KAF0441471.1 transcriptional regulator [Pediococcus pentosaceus]MBF7108641.1 Rha family transcriptional regulator [Pediococcus pentosaceus]MCE5961129.1 Rha family transcriptional regulator [Pediococcus pentosaceus]
MKSNVVFTETFSLYDEPFTTADMIAEYAGVSKHAVNQLVRQYKNDLEEYGILAFEMRKLSGRGRPKKIYQLSEEQATLLITYLDNTPQVRAFKKELVRQFYAMKTELLQRQLVRTSGKAGRREMTDAIKESSVLSDKWYVYSNFTKLLYKTALGFDVSKLREARRVDKKATPLDFLNKAELDALNKRQNQITTLIDLGMDYQAIKDVLSNQGVIYQTTLKIPEKARN